MFRDGDGGRGLDAQAWRRAKALFCDLLEAPTVERAELAARRLDDESPAVAAEVRSLLAAHEEEECFVEAVVERERATFASDALLLGRRLGAWEIVRHLDDGGMGSVFLARRADGAYEARAAVKLASPLLARSEDARRRFEAERRTLAALGHPGIARLLDGGTTEEGWPYLVMEYVEGVPVDEHCDRHGLSTRDRLALFLTACDAVEHAHRNLVVHRDLKPQNVLVTPEGWVTLLDFGVAKLIASEGAEPDLTVGGSPPFTPDYASPEQVLGGPISTASDVYSLGVVLYELLTGERPFRTGAAAPGELVRSAATRRVEAPSERVRRQDGDTARRRAALRGTHPRGHERELAGDLDRIVGKALAPEPERRYGTVDHLAEDVRRHLEGRPVRARAPTFAYRARKLVRRHRALVATGLVVSALLAAGFGTAVQQWRRAAAAGERAELEASRVRSTNRFLVSLFEAGNPRWYVDREAKGPETRIVDVLDEASRRIDRDLATGPAERADLHHVLGDAFLAIGMGERAGPHFERSLALHTLAFGELHEETARSWYYMTAVAETLPERIERFRRSVAIEERLEQPSTNYPWALSDGAAALAQAGLRGEAEEWLARARAIAEHRAEDDPLRFNVLVQEARVARIAGDLERAERRLAEAEPWRGELERHPRIGTVLDGELAFLALSRGGFDAAAVFARRCAEAARALGIERPDCREALDEALARQSGTG